MLAVEDNELLGIALYPNPASNLVNIGLPNTVVGSTTFEITNSLGQVVRRLQHEAAGAPVQLDISSLTQGIYFIAIENQNSRTVEKLIVR